MVILRIEMTEKLFKKASIKTHINLVKKHGEKRKNHVVWASLAGLGL